MQKYLKMVLFLYINILMCICTFMVLCFCSLIYLFNCLFIRIFALLKMQVGVYHIILWFKYIFNQKYIYTSMVLQIIANNGVLFTHLAFKDINIQLYKPFIYRA